MDKQITTWKEFFVATGHTFAEKFLEVIPLIIGALFTLLIGWLVAKAISFILFKLLKSVKFDNIAQKEPFAGYIQRADIKVAPSLFVRKITYWVIFLFFIVTAFEIMGWTAISLEINKLINYLPNLFAAIIIFIIGIYIISFVRDFIRAATASLGIGAGKFLSGFVFYLLLIILSLTAIKQAGVDTTIITSNLTLVIGAILLAFSISYGFASRDILANILATFFSRRVFEVGQTIQFEDVEGEIVEIKSVSVKMKTADGEIIVPTQTLMSSKVKIIKPTA